MKVHATKSIVASESLNRILSGHFGVMPLAVHDDEAGALAAVAESPGDLAVIKTDSGWAESFAKKGAGGAAIVGVLPVLAENGVPPLLLAGHVEAQPSGDDCTLLISRRAPHAAVRWSVAAGGAHVICLGGFLGDEELGTNGYARSSDIVVAGRFPDQIKV